MSKCFMSGCSLASYSPRLVEKTILYLKNIYPDLSTVQKCCGSPTLLMGETKNFEMRFSDLLWDINSCKTDELIVACQNCYKLLKESKDFKVTSLWEILAKSEFLEDFKNKGKNSDVTFTIHHSCYSKKEASIQENIKIILNKLGYSYVEPEYISCCGQGGMAGATNPMIAKKITEKRINSFETQHVVTYCASCKGSMSSSGAKAWHILDLFFGELINSRSEPPKDVSLAKSWLNRYTSKSKIEVIYDKKS
ncbi:MAG: heterodisulfide reductase-related iron-sulfur binding cluster [Lachnospirales bacterium]